MAEIMQVMDAAKGIMRQSGNMHQWGDGYPSEAVITADIQMLMASSVASWISASHMIGTSV